MATVTLTEIRKAFGSVEVIHGVSLHVEDGEFVSLVGPSGCGKSTILRMIAGLEKISGGTITIGDRVVNGVPPKDRDVAMVFQNYALYPHMSVFDNMAFGLKQRRIAKAEIAERVNRAAEILGLADMLGRHPRQLSGGQRQRVAMGRAIVRNPQLFLFDEPLSNLDAKLRVQMRGEIKQLSRRLGTTAIYVTHDQIEAMTMSDRIVVLNGGRIEQIGAPLDLYDRPANMFVAQFIGSPSMNFFRGRLEGGSGGAVFRTADGTAFPFTAGLIDAPPRDAVLGVRPEHWRVSTEGNGIPARVSVVEPTGADLHLRCAMAGHGIDVVMTERLPCQPDDILHLTCPPEHVHMFDPLTDQRFTRAASLRRHP